MGLLFVKRCILCGKDLPSDAPAMLCETCNGGLTRYRCTEAIRIPDTDGTAAAFYYTDQIRYAMQRFKFRQKAGYAEWFAAEMAPLLARHLNDWRPDCITFTPIGWLRRRERGYNQAELLARAVAKPFSLPCYETLKKQRFIGRQSQQKDVAARKENMEHAFRPGKAAALAGKSVVLVDDIITTGATAAAAARTLRAMGAARVYLLAATRTPLGSSHQNSTGGDSS